jgi:serine/threonine-protein kinase
MAERQTSTERAALTSALSSHYQIEREIGRGGMAVVYLARDAKHDRRVAIKVLDPDLGAVLGVDRFLSEIRVTATLQHPNLLPLFDSGEVSGLLYYVMPFIEGETLRARIDREKQLPVDEAVRIGVAIANAADYAHSHGIIHRDLKPDNILLQSGQPVVADFGIALAVSNSSGGRLTQTGITLGTPEYMSPEQATGDRAIDARSDVYAIGAMIYEMLIGEPPHTGATSQAIIARIVTERAPSVRDRRSSVPEHVDAAIARALETLPADRFATAKEFADALQGRGLPRSTHAARATRSRPTRAMVGAAGLAACVAIAATIGWWRSAHRPPLAVERFRVDVPPGFAFGAGAGKRVALSPDGRSVAFASGDARLYIRRLDQVDPVLVPNARPIAPELHFSSDGRWIAYWDHGPNKIPIGVGDTAATPTRLVSLDKLGAIISFGADEMIYAFENAVWSVPSSGGTPRKLAAMDTTLDAAWIGRGIMLPDGKTIAFAVNPRGTRGYDDMRLALLSIDDGRRTLLENVQGIGVHGYVDGILVFSRTNGRVLGVRVDLRHRKAIGEPQELMPTVSVPSTNIAVNENGTVAYIAAGFPPSRVEVVDELGTVATTLSEIRPYLGAVPSPDGKHIALTSAAQNEVMLWQYDVESRVMTRVTPTPVARPTWSADGRRLAFIGTVPSLPGNAIWTAIDGSSGVAPIPGIAALGFPISVLSLTHDGKYAVVARGIRPGEPAGTSIVTAVPLDGGAPIPILEHANNPLSFEVSPNGRWIAYESREAGDHNVFIRPFPRGDGQIQISADQGDDPSWSPDGRTLYYRHNDVYRAVSLDVSGPMPRVLRSEPLFARRDLAANPVNSFAVHPDGKHFVVTRRLGDGTNLYVAVNWASEILPKFEGK